MKKSYFRGLIEKVNAFSRMKTISAQYQHKLFQARLINQTDSNVMGHHGLVAITTAWQQGDPYLNPS